MNDDIFRFLDGSAPYEGVWLGQEHPIRRGLFWWRKPLRETLDGQAEALRQITAERNLLIDRLARERKRNEILMQDNMALNERLDGIRVAKVG